VAETVNRIGDVLVLVGGRGGHAVIPQPTPLTRLNYFDGKFLRADDLSREQEYLRALVAFSNQAGGSGVVHGYGARLSTRGDQLELGPGLAIDPAGRVLLLPQTVSIAIGELISASARPDLATGLKALRGDLPVQRLPGPAAVSGAEFGDCVTTAEAPPSQVVQGAELYLLSIAHAEALCGEENVYGRLCEDACVTTTERPYRVEGVAVRAIPLRLLTPLATTSALLLDQRHLRSLVASAYYADEARRMASLISRQGLALDAWCLGAAAQGGTDVPIAVLARSGSQTVFLDAWTARRERTEPPPRRYWAWRMAMRPWDVFLAQVLQFQCQLTEALRRAPTGEPTGDPCEPSNQALRDASRFLAEVEQRYIRPIAVEAVHGEPLRPMADLPAAAELPAFLERISGLRTRVSAVLTGAAIGAQSRILIQGGIVELPPAGYLPVTPSTTVPVNVQVRQLLGEGLDLRFCICRPDFVAHALEEAQHLDRISLLQGLDHPDAKPAVDILVPNGELVRGGPEVAGKGFDVLVSLAPGGGGDNPGTPGSPTREPLFAAVRSRLGLASAGAVSATTVHGAGRGEVTDLGGLAFHFAGATEAPFGLNVNDLAAVLAFPAPDRLETLGKLRATPEEAHAAVHDSPLFLPRLNLVAAEAVRAVTELRTAAGEGLVPEPGRFRLAVKPGERRVVAMWITLRVDRGVLALQPGDSTPVSLVVDFAMPARTPSVTSSQFRGDLRVDQVIPGAGFGRRVVGRLSAIGSIRSVVNGTPEPERAGAIDAAVTVTLSAPAGQPAKLRIELDGGARIFTLDASWEIDPIAASLELTVRQRGSTIPLATATLNENADVLRAGNPVHTLALSTLDILGASLGDPSFADGAAALLFPPPPPQPVEQTVRATTDWVLFHRRREERCGEVERPVEAPPRRYAVYQLRIQEPAEFKRLREALLRDDEAVVAAAGFVPVDQVEFAGGLPTLLSGPEGVRLAWRQAGAGNTVLYATIATFAQVDGDALARARLGRLEAVLASVSSFDQALSESLPQVPTALAAPGTDGVIVFITTQVEATTCHTVYAVKPDFHDRAEALLSQGDLASFLKARINGEPMATPLGTATFTRDGAGLIMDQSTNAVIQAWQALGEVTPDVVFVFSMNGDPKAGDERLRDERAQAIATLVGAGTIDPRRRLTDQPVPGDCPAIAILLTRPKGP
jgi:hypothetical protein